MLGFMLSSMLGSMWVLCVFYLGPVWILCWFCVASGWVLFWVRVLVSMRILIGFDSFFLFYLSSSSGYIGFRCVVLFVFDLGSSLGFSWCVFGLDLGSIWVLYFGFCLASICFF